MGKNRGPSLSHDPELNTGSTILRRYLDLPKYVSLLHSTAVYVQRVDLFPDKLEGVLTPGIRKAIDEAHALGQSPYDANGFSDKARRGVYLSCWSLGADDNMALWQLYGSPETGVVITTTTQRLIQAALQWSLRERVEIFKVRYIDHSKNPNMVIGRYTDPLRYKHKAYSFEREVRVVVSRVGTRKSKPRGLAMPVDLAALIRSVVVGPEAPDWFFHLVKDISGRYGLNAPVRRSKLAYVTTASR
jgi:hypothetical protein